MTLRIVVAGTDTDIGKTVFAAGLTHLLDGVYWKPVQAGLEGETDTEIARRLSGLDRSHFLAEAWRLKLAASPHLAAEREGLVIDPGALGLPVLERPLIVEGAGGLMVPLNRHALYIDVFAGWGLPVVLCARTSLGTLNHTLLSVEALQRRGIPILGLALLGEPHADNERTLAALSGVRVLGRLPRLDPLTPESLRAAFGAAFRREQFVS
ncbi:MAG TPA: dethiobiotin synthase [Steroidobacteraceae bacterium]|jgi:dethiobiotin synthetase|nr:dethiobiotin synthase [Steroidobacteraceae bacterium]